MYEYTLVALIALLFIIILDRKLLRTRIIAWKNSRLWKTTAVFVLFQLVLDNYFTAKGLLVFNPHTVIGIYLPFIPIENILFGIELLWLSIILYSFFQTK